METKTTANIPNQLIDMHLVFGNICMKCPVCQNIMRVRLSLKQNKQLIKITCDRCHITPVKRRVNPQMQKAIMMNNSN